MGSKVRKRVTRLKLDMLAQPDAITCGPTSLHALYRYYGDDVSLLDVVHDIEALPTGGTLAVTLGRHALARGYEARIITYNLQVFDPTWFAEGVDLLAKLAAQRKHKRGSKLAYATEQYEAFLREGGSIVYRELAPALIRRYLTRGVPVLTGLSATYLYSCARELDDEYDDVRGEPSGHFVVLCGYDRNTKLVRVADPLGNNPGYDAHYYDVPMARVLSSILLGILTYDANLLVIEPTHRSALRGAGK